MGFLDIHVHAGLPLGFEIPPFPCSEDGMASHAKLQKPCFCNCLSSGTFPFYI